MNAAAEAKPVDAAVREEIRTNVAENLLVEAGAGTGKTTSLVARIVEILASGRSDVDRLGVITFTHKAAAELSARVRESLETAIQYESDPKRHERLEDAARGLYRARIETIHSFATNILRERPVEARLDPEFRGLTDLESELLFREASSEWLAELLSSEREELDVALNLGLGPEEIRDAAHLIYEHRYLLPLTPFEAGGTDSSEVDAWLDENADEFQRILDRCNNVENKALPSIQGVLDFKSRLSIEGTTPAARARLIAGSMPGVNLNAGAAGDWDDPDDLRRWKKDLAPEWRALSETVPVAMRAAALADLLPDIEEFVHAYEQRRRSDGVADFDDLIVWARDLVRDDIAVRRYFQRRFRALLIDEFQDTDPIQVELAMLLTSDDQESNNWRDLRPASGKLFVVGDPKQSVYRFRRADIGIYDEVKGGALADGLRQIVQNFRSVPRVIEWVNHTFDRLFEERVGCQPANVALKESPFEEPQKRPPVVVVRGRFPEALAADVRTEEAEAVAALLDPAVRGPEPWLVRDQASAEIRSACWRDVAILLPRRTGLEAYEDALAALGVPYRHEGSRDYFQRDEVRDLIFLLRSIDDPRDRISLIGALRSSAFGCSDSDLVVHAGTGGRWDYRFEQESQSERVVGAFEVLRGLHRAREKLSLQLLVQRVLAESRLVEVALTQPDGAQAAANLQAIVEQARAFAGAGAGGPRPFTRWLAENTEQEANEIDAGIAEETDDVVRIMTMHGAKGLEFPIVALANLGGVGSSQAGPVPDESANRLHFHVGTWTKGSRFETPGYEESWDEEKAALELEEVRLLYVAATRARDHLVIPDFTGKTRPGPLLERLGPLLPEKDGHEEEIDGVWMLDVSRVERPAPIEEKRRRVSARERKTALAAREGWRAEHDELIRDARQGLKLTVASSVKRSVRPMAAEASRSDAAMLVSEGPPLEIGDALHKLMEKVSLPDAEDLEMLAQAICGEFGIPEHAGEVVEMARRCLDSPTVKRAIASGAYEREVPFALSEADGYTVGRVDLVFRDGEEVVVLDYKTDAVEPNRCSEHADEHYAGQVGTYLSAIRRAANLDVGPATLIYCRSGVEVTLSAEGS